MKIISKKISYDELISRVPGVIPSIVDSWTVPYIHSCNTSEEKVYYSYDSAVMATKSYNINSSELKHNTEFINFDVNNLREFTSGNYGLIPSDIIISKNIASKITDYTDIYVNIPDGNGGFYDLSWPKQDSDPHYDGRKIISGGTEIKIITYHTLIKWYKFFNEYYNLIKSPDYERTYENALDYYEKEVEVKNDEEYAYYESLDLTFESRGGKSMYEWICNNCIIQFNIPKEYADKWGSTSMYFTDALKWYWWFSERIDLYSGVTTLEDCKETDDCCDSQKYVELGGKGFYNAISEWVNNNIRFNPTSTNSASVTIPITFTTSIDDLGEMSIISNEWEAGTDYHNTMLSTIEGVTGGTIVNMPYIIDDNGNVVYINESKLIKDGGNRKGYEYSEEYSDISYKEDDWVDYTDKYISDNVELFASDGIAQNGQLEAVTSYTYSPVNGKIIYNPTEIKSKIKYNNIKTASINGDAYDVIDGEYVVMCYDMPSIANVNYKNGTKLQVFKDGDLKYVIINGKRKYAEKDSHGIDKIYLFKCYDESDNGCPLSSGTYVIYDNVLYLTDNNGISIEEIDSETKYQYPILDGYFDIDNNRFYVSGNSVVVSNGYTYDESTDTYTYEFRELNEDELISFGINGFIVNSDTNTVEINHLFDEIDCTVVAGFCDSKLDLLRRKEISTDDLGNELPGHFKSIVNANSGNGQSRYNNAYNECTLDMLYRVGEVASLTVNNDLSDETYDYYNGDIITDITFYYKDKYGERKYSNSALNDDALIAISASTEEYENGSEDDGVLNKMYCDITYYIGAVIKVKKQPNNETASANTYELASEYHSGVKYIDTVSVVESVGDYYLGNGSKFTYKYYSLNQEPSSIHLSDYNDDVTAEASTYFEMKPLLYILNNGEIENVDDEVYLSGWSKNNNVLVTPTTRTEFNMASSFPQNVDANIYIDRGINAALEKHLKLQEIRTMEALETFSNGIFKLNNY